MQLHQLQPKHRLKKRKRVGRGGKRGTYSGKGIKGQKSRSGRKMQPIMRELIKRYPKLRGYRQVVKPRFSTIVNLRTLEKEFNPGDKITPFVLFEKKIIRKIKGKIPSVKILSQGEIKKEFIIEGCNISRAAREKIEKAGGTVKISN